MQEKPVQSRLLFMYGRQSITVVYAHTGSAVRISSLCYILGEGKTAIQLFKTVVNVFSTSYFWHVWVGGIMISPKQEAQLVSMASQSLWPVLIGPTAASTTSSPADQTRTLAWAEVCRIRISSYKRKLHFQRWAHESKSVTLGACCKVKRCYIKPRGSLLTKSIARI